MNLNKFRNTSENPYLDKKTCNVKIPRQVPQNVNTIRSNVNIPRQILPINRQRENTEYYHDGALGVGSLCVWGGGALAAYTWRGHWEGTLGRGSRSEQRDRALGGGTGKAKHKN